MTVDTHKGLYCYIYTRLTFGVVSTPSIFPNVINIVLQGLLNVICYLDDIHKRGRSVEEHLHNVGVSPQCGCSSTLRTMFWHDSRSMASEPSKLSVHFSVYP